MQVFLLWPQRGGHASPTPSKPSSSFRGLRTAPLIPPSPQGLPSSPLHHLLCVWFLVLLSFPSFSKPVNLFPPPLGKKPLTLPSSSRSTPLLSIYTRLPKFSCSLFPNFPCTFQFNPIWILVTLLHFSLLRSPMFSWFLGSNLIWLLFSDWSNSDSAPWIGASPVWKGYLAREPKR